MQNRDESNNKLLIKHEEMFMSDEKKVVHEIKLSKPVLVLLWFVAIGFLGKPVGNMLIPEVMAELEGGGKVYSPFYVEIKHSGSIAN